MKKFKEQVKSLDSEVFKKINIFLKENGLENAEVTGLKINFSDKTVQSCPPGKELYCWKDVSGKTYCKCI